MSTNYRQSDNKEISKLKPPISYFIENSKIEFSHKLVYSIYKINANYIQAQASPINHIRKIEFREFIKWLHSKQIIQAFDHGLLMNQLFRTHVHTYTFAIGVSE